MKDELTLQEKLCDLRNERKLKLSELSQETGIPTSTLQRLENDENIRAGYQDIATLAEFYNVSTDYLFGLTDNRQHRSIAVDELKLSDKAIKVLKSDNFNNRLISELISHEDFPSLLNSIEVYVDRKMSAQMSVLNANYQLTEKALKKDFKITNRDQIMTLLEDAQINEDEYLRFRISERFSCIMKKMYDSHKIDISPEEETYVMDEVKKSVDLVLKEKDTDEFIINFILDSLKLQRSAITDDEAKTLISIYRRSEAFYIPPVMNRNDKRKWKNGTKGKQTGKSYKR